MISAVVRVTQSIAFPGPRNRLHEVWLVDDAVISRRPVSGTFLVAFKADALAGDLDASEQQAIMEARRVCERLNRAFSDIILATRAVFETLDNRGAL